MAEKDICKENKYKEDSSGKSYASTHDTKDDSRSFNIFLYICAVSVLAGILIEVLDFTKHATTSNNSKELIKRNYWVYSAYNDVENPNGLLKHVHLVLSRLGYEKSSNSTPWSLLWSHDYPFRVLYPNLHRLKPHQMVNHYPGSGFITNKVDLATTNLQNIPKAFKLPQDKEEFLDYARSHQSSLFLEKHNQHRGVFLKNVTDIDVASGESFVQEYVQNPFLVDGYKFDIGVYVVVTSVNPLRAYWYKGDVLFRYCPAKYYPFDPKNLDKYVVADDYLPTWQVPSLSGPYSALGGSMKGAFDAYVRKQGKDPSKIWDGVQEAIADVLLAKEHHIVQALKNYPSQDNFFEMMRFDLVVDEDLNVYLLEANMSPNLSSAHFPPNQLLYEQVLYNLFGVVGLADYANERRGLDEREATSSKAMVSTFKNIAVYSEECTSICKGDCSSQGGNNYSVCALCRPCMEPKLRSSFLKAHTEFLHRGDFARLVPPEMKQGSIIQEGSLEHLTETNRLQHLWYQGKCNIDTRWCS